MSARWTSLGISPRLLLVLAGLVIIPMITGFSASASFESSAAHGGGDGYFYTGSHTAHGMDCASCHQGDVRRDGVELWSEPAGLFDQGYVAGTTYTVHVALLNETKGLDRQGACTKGMGGCNRNSFVAEIHDRSGAPSGSLCVDGAALVAGACESDVGEETLLMAGGAAIGGNSQRKPVVCSLTVTTGCIDVAALKAAGKSDAEVSAILVAAVRGRVAWQFQWRASAGVSEPVQLYLGLVDGDGGNTVDPHHNDYQGDAVVMVERTIRAEGDPGPAAPSCQAGSDGLGGGMHTAAMPLSVVASLIFALAALVIVRRRAL